MNKSSRKVIALEAILRKCRNVITLGVKPNFSDYEEHERDLILNADKIYFPTTFYADLFDAMGKATFPSYHTYKCVQDKIKQTALFNLLKIPHPETRVFYSKKSRAVIKDYFKFPFIAKIPRGSAMGRGVFLIQDDKALAEYLEQTDVAYIQEYIKCDRDIRVVVIGKKAVHAYWRIVPADEYRSNVAVGGRIDLSPVPDIAINLALDTARKCGFDNVGIDICISGERCYILEANMKYGKEGFRQANINYISLMEEMIENDEI